MVVLPGDSVHQDDYDDWVEPTKILKNFEQCLEYVIGYFGYELEMIYQLSPKEWQEFSNETRKEMIKNKTKKIILDHDDSAVRIVVFKL